MVDDAAKPGPRDGSLPMLLPLAGLIVGLVLFILFGARTSVFGVIPFALGGLVVGGVLAVLRRRSRSHAHQEINR